MKCMTCNKRECEHENTTLCAPCDRDEWRDATLRANKRFQYAEDQLRRIHEQVGRYLVDARLVVNYPCNYEELYEVLRGLNK